MNAPRQGLLKTASILFIVFGAIASVISIIAAFLMVWLASKSSDLGGPGIDILSNVQYAFSMLLSIFDLVIGILCVKKAGDPANAQFFLTLGIILCALSLILMIIGIVNDNFQTTSLICFLLPILYIVGGILNKKAL